MEPDFEEDAVKSVVIAAIVIFSWPGGASALCKYKAADGSVTYSQSCTSMSNKEIDQSAREVMDSHAEQKKVGQSMEGRRLRGYEYSVTTNSGMRIKMVEPNKAPPDKEFTTQ